MSDGLLGLDRYYSSAGFYAPVGSGADDPYRNAWELGVHWRHTYQRSVLQETTLAGIPEMVTVTRPDGDFRHFKLIGGHWSGREDKQETLQELTQDGQRTGWQYTLVDNSVEQFDREGKIISWMLPSGVSIGMIYSTASTNPTVASIPGLLIEVVHVTGRSIRFFYDEQNRLVRVLDPAGNERLYKYDLEGTLEAVALPDADGDYLYSVKYLYNEPANNANYSSGRLLTGILGDGDIRFATYKYSHNRVVDEWHGSSFANRLQMTYFPSGTNYANGFSRMTFALDRFEQRDFVLSNGVIKERGRKKCTSYNCSVVLSETKTTYRAGDGNVDTLSDGRGGVTKFGYDARGRRSSKRELFAASGSDALASRAIETDWHSTLNSPLEQRTINSAGGVESLVRWGYNVRGQVTGHCQIDPADSVAMNYECSATTAPPVGAKVRRTVTTYCEQPDVVAGTCPRVGLVTFINGPRPLGDAGMSIAQDDVTTYNYRQADDPTCASDGACTHRRGDLWKITNALGQVTEYVAYDKSGRVTRLRDSTVPIPISSTIRAAG